jgi:hypothetical protein
VNKSPYLEISHQDNITYVANLIFDAATFETWPTLLKDAKLIVVNIA